MSSPSQTQLRIAIMAGPGDSPSSSPSSSVAYKRRSMNTKLPATLVLIWEVCLTSGGTAHLPGERDGGRLQKTLAPRRRGGSYFWQGRGTSPCPCWRRQMHARPEIDRRVLRQILLDAVPLDAVKWGHQLTSIRALGDGQHELTFATGLITVVDLVVGADGANSSVRPLLSSATLIFHGITGVGISLAPTLASLPDNRDIIEGVGRGSLYAAEDDKILALHRNGDGRIRGYAWHQNTLEWSLPCDPKEARKTLLELYFDWAPWMRKFIEQGDESAIYPRPLFHLVVGYRWEHKPGVTVIGDAAHLMSPFARAGATLAMRDGLELGLVIAEAVSKGLGREEREVAVVRWEAEMFEKVEKFAALTASNLEVDISTSAPQSAVEAFTHSL